MSDMPQGRQTVSDDEIVAYMKRADEPAFVAHEIADQFGINDETARQRLTSLWREGRIHRKKPSKRTVMWWSDADHDYSAARA